MKFFESPFSYLTPAFILGILLGELIEFPVHWLWLVAACVPLIFTNFIKEISRFFLPFALIVVALIGAMLIQFVRNIDHGVTAGERPRVAVVTEAEVINKDWKKTLLTVKKEKRNGQWNATNQQVLIYSQSQFHEGDVILIQSDFQKIKNQGNPGEFDAEAYWKGKNVHWIGFVGGEEYSLLDHQPNGGLGLFFQKIRNSLSGSLEKHLGTEQVALARALLLGDKGKLSAETRESFGNAGAMHVLAISGLHVGIIMYLLFFLFKQFPRWVSKSNAVIASLLFIWLYAAISGGSPSVLRSTLMFSVLLIGQQTGRTGNNTNTLFFSAFILLAINPLLIFDIGFQLSYAAMLGIFLYYDRVQSLFPIHNKWLRKAWDGTAIGIAAQIFTIPLVLHYFHQFPNYFWLTNLGIMVLAGVILALGMLFFAFQAVPLLNVVFAFLLGWSLLGLLTFVGWVDALPAGVAVGFDPSIFEIVLFYLVITILSFRFHQHRKWVLISLAGVLIALFASWQWSRVQLGSQSELVIFNSTRPVIAIKSNDQIIGCCLKGDEEKALRMLKPYQKVRTGQIQLIAIDESQTSIRVGDQKVQIEHTNNGFSITHNDDEWFLRTRYRMIDSTDARVIDMPYLESNAKHYSLSNGAFICKL